MTWQSKVTSGNTNGVIRKQPNKLYIHVHIYKYWWNLNLEPTPTTNKVTQTHTHTQWQCMSRHTMAANKTTLCKHLHKRKVFPSQVYDLRTVTSLYKNKHTHTHTHTHAQTHRVYLVIRVTKKRPRVQARKRIHKVVTHHASHICTTY